MHRRDACAILLRCLFLFVFGVGTHAHGRPVSSEATVLQEAPILLAQTKLPTLEDVVFIESRVDRESAYLGEAVNLTLTFGQLKFRGIRVQNYYKARQIRLPDTEGFFAGKLVEESREVTRDGHAYTLTVYRVPLFPTRPGDLFIGSWRWQGTARGSTAGGARTLQIDKRTGPITIAVAPLPPAPPGFGGAVGRFQMATTIDSTDLVQGIPTRFYLEIEGVGNSQSLRAPNLSGGDWYRLGEPLQSEAAAVSGSDRAFVKRFEYALMPLQDGAFDLGPFSFTYFSPAEKDYVTVTAPLLHVRVGASAANEQLVVVGGLGRGGQGGLRVMDDGRLPLATKGGTIEVKRSWHGTIVVLCVLPVLVFLVVYALRYALGLQFSSRQGGSVRTRLNEAMVGAVPAEGLRDGILREIERVTGWKTAGMTAPEVESALLRLGWGGMAAELGGILRQCESFRYGGAQPEAAVVKKMGEQTIVVLEQIAAWGKSQ
ncbi:MAG: BatD family protein [Candidatus Hydrogenedentes bacterium]|nr:BatD family protein [Candidatus Hydrogenedentota bacterium]